MADIKINVRVVEGQAKAALAGLQKQTKQADQAFSSLNVSIKQVSSATSVFLGNIASRAFTEVISSIKGLVTGSITLAGQLETTATKFEVLTGSAGRANNLLKELQEFSASTPFQFQEVSNAASKLLAFGIAADDVKPKLQVLGDVAAASGSSLNEVAFVFGQVSAAGKLTGERLKQFEERAIPIGPAIAKTMGVAESSVRDLVSKGEVDFKTFEKAFESLNQKGGAAFEGMIKLSKTFDGRISTLKDNFVIFQQTIGTELLPAMKAIVIGLTALVDNITKFTTEAKFAASSAEFIVTAFNFLIKGTIIAINTIQVFRLVLTEIAVVITGILGAAFAAVIEQIKAFVNTAKLVAGAFGISTKALDGFIETLNGVQFAGIDVAKDLQKNANSIVKDMTSLSVAGDNFGNAMEAAFNKEKKAAADAANFVGPLFQEQKKQIQGLTEEQKAQQKTQLDNKIKHEQAILAEEQKAFLAKQEQQAEFHAKQSETQAAINLAKYEQQFYSDGQLTALEEQTIATFKQYQEEKILNEQIAAQTTLGNKQKVAELELKLAQSQAKFELDTVKATAKSKKEQKDLELKQQQDFFSAAISLSNSENKTLLRIGQAAALAQLAIKTPEAIGNSYAFGTKFGGPALGALFGAVAAAAMAAQAAQIVGVKFAEGGIVPGSSFSGDQIQARLNSGEMVLNRQQQAQLFSMANGSGNSGEQIIQVNNVIELDGEVVARSVSRQVANGLKLGEVA